jgi:hypothetical protein
MVEECGPSANARTSEDVEDTFAYRESEVLNIRGGYMVVYYDQCRITMSAKLPEAEKQRGQAELLRWRSLLEPRGGGTYWWYVDGGEQPLLIGSDSRADWRLNAE